MFRDYLYLKRGVFALVGALLALFNIGLFLYGINVEVYAYIDILSLVVIIFYFLGDYYFYRKHYKKVKELRDNYLLGPIEFFPKSEIEKLYLEMIEGTCRILKDVNDKDLKNKQELIDYYTIWAHQIKTPISAMRLLLEDHEDPKLEMELLKIENYVEMVLSYLKVVDRDRDFVFEEVDLDKIIKEEIKRASVIFILKKIRISYEGVDKKVLSDAKWLGFVIGQILANALKYTKSDGEIKIFWRDDTLYIKDNGIGIAKEDLPLIFERGYSGTVGRKDKRATGIGLYLSKKFCDILNIEIKIASKVKEGTTVGLTFKERGLRFDDLT